MNRGYWLSLFSFFALLAIIVIQFFWIIQGATLKEELFNEKAKIVLAKASEAITNDKATCKKIGESLDDQNPEPPSQFEVVDSLFNYYLEFYKINMNYSYKIIPTDPKTNELTTDAQNVFNQELNRSAFPSAIKLQLVFPDKREFILAEMGLMFFASIGLITLVFIFFLLTTQSLIKERKVAERTAEFINNMTHEFKTPLTNIGLANKLISKKAENSKVINYTKIIDTEKHKLGKQIEQVLSLATAEKSASELSFISIDFHELIREVEKTMALQLNEKNGILKLTLNASNSKMYGDKTHLTNTICNLINNAIKYNNNPPNIQLKTESVDGFIHCSIQDNGIGIKPSEQSKIFATYYRVQKGNVHNQKGFGIGLSYAKKIVELHRGSISVNSAIDIGSTFTIKLPNEDH